MAWQAFAMAGLSLFQTSRQIRQAKRQERMALEAKIRRDRFILANDDLLREQDEVLVELAKGQASEINAGVTEAKAQRLRVAERSVVNSALVATYRGVEGGSVLEIEEDIEEAAASDLTKAERYRRKAIRQHEITTRHARIQNEFNRMGRLYQVQTGAVPKGDYTGMLVSGLVRAATSYASAGGKFPSFGGGAPKDVFYTGKAELPW